METRIKDAYNTLHKFMEYEDFDLHTLNYIFTNIEFRSCLYFNNYCNIIIKDKNQEWLLWKEDHEFIICYKKQKINLRDFILQFELFDEDKLLKFEILALKQL